MRPAAGPDGAMPVMGEEVVVDGLDLVPLPPNEIELRVRYGQGLSDGTEIVVEGKPVTISGLHDEPVTLLALGEKQLRFQLPVPPGDYSKWLAQRPTMPLVVTVRSKYSNHAKHGFSFDAKVVAPKP